jgi:hypothetical protein
MRSDAGETECLPKSGPGATVVRPVKGKRKFPAKCGRKYGWRTLSSLYEKTRLVPVCILALGDLVSMWLAAFGEAVRLK